MTATAHVERQPPPAPAPADGAGVARDAVTFEGIRRVARVERRKLGSQFAIRVLALVCVLGPFLFAAILRIQSGTPRDTIYGAWIHASGFALSLVVLSFAGTWGFPIIAGVVAGDLFASEDRYGTWKTVLTRDRARAEVFAGKALAAATYVVGMLLVTAVASVVSGLVLVGAGRLVSLDGTVLSFGHQLFVTALSWLVCVPAALAFTALAILLSVATRNGIMGVLGPGLAALAMQLLLLVGAGVWVHSLLVSSAFTTWTALLRDHPFLGPLLLGVAVSILWICACLAVAWRLLARRDFAGAPVARRPGWVMPVRVFGTLAVTVVVLAVAGGWGAPGVTATRLQASITPTFNNLTLLQQSLLGRTVPVGAQLNILPTCNRRGGASSGPGEWVCTLNVVIPQSGAVPFSQTLVTYDVSVASNGCWKAESPPAFIGQQTMRDASGSTVVNPLFTIYGCFDPL